MSAFVEHHVRRDPSGNYLDVCFSLFAWVGRQRDEDSAVSHTNRYHWVCQVQETGHTRACDTMGDANSEVQAVADLSDHLRIEHKVTATWEA